MGGPHVTSESINDKNVEVLLRFPIEHHSRVAQDDIDRVQEFRKCIECFLCQDVCHVLREHRLHEEFIGPRFLLYAAALEICDDRAAPPAEVIEYACELLGVAPPPLVPFDEAELSTMARSFYRDNKLVSNKRIKQELGVELRYPTYRDGLRALLRDEDVNP